MAARELDGFDALPRRARPVSRPPRCGTCGWPQPALTVETRTPKHTLTRILNEWWCGWCQERLGVSRAALRELGVDPGPDRRLYFVGRRRIEWNVQRERVWH